MKKPPPLPRQSPPPPPPGVRRPRSWKYLSPRELLNLKNLFFAARIMVEGAYAGRHGSPFRGSSPEFVEYRNYNPGDPLDAIDWKAFARTDRYYIKLTEKETDMNCYLLLDTSASMGYGGPELRAQVPSVKISKLEYASLIAAALTYLIVKQGDKVSLTLYDEAVRKHLPSGGTFPHLYSILSELEKRRPGGSTSTADVLRKVFSLCPRRGLLIILSDFYDEPEDLFKALSLYAHRRFEVIIFHILHEYEYQLPPLDHLRLVDAETGDQLTCSTPDLRASYDQQIREYIQSIRSLARARNIDYNFIHTGTPYQHALQRYLLRRSSLRT